MQQRPAQSVHVDNTTEVDGVTYLHLALTLNGQGVEMVIPVNATLELQAAWQAFND